MATRGELFKKDLLHRHNVVQKERRSSTKNLRHLPDTDKIAEAERTAGRVLLQGLEEGVIAIKIVNRKPRS